MRSSLDPAYQFSRWITHLALGFYFSRIERFHVERVPGTGPVLLTSNHPNSLTDALVIGASVPRKVNFVATVQLFRAAPVRWFLSRCGVIPINRVKDDPKAMRSVLATFEACYRVMEMGEAVAIFPEGITHDDPQLKTVKTGAARMALELESRHEGKLGLRIVPVGITFSAKEKYRSEVLVNFGEPILVRDWLGQYSEDRHECIRQLTQCIEQGIEGLMLHLRELGRLRLIKAVQRLYLDQLRVANRVIHEPLRPRAEELVLTQAIARAVDYTCEREPERAEAFTRKLNHFEYLLRKLNLTEDELGEFEGRAHLGWRSFAWAFPALLLLPVAIYGYLHRALPVLFIQAALRRRPPELSGKTHVSTTTLLAGLVAFPVCYAFYVGLFHLLFGFPASLWYGLSLPPAGLVTHYYGAHLKRFRLSLRCAVIQIRAPATARRITALRNELVSMVDEARWRVPSEALSREKPF